MAHLLHRRPNSVHRFGILFLFLFALFTYSGRLNAQTIWGISGNSLVSFDASMPGVVTSSGAITGVDAAQAIVGMDFRPLNGSLYLLGYDASTGAARLYTLDRTTAVATPVGTADVMLAAGMMQVGMDFNPTVDRIRVTDASNNNYRLHPSTGALLFTDGTLAYAAADINNGMDPQVSAVAYTNSYIGATSTTLYDFDAALNVLTTQIPPNNGTLNTIGSAGIMTTPGSVADMDIYYDQMSSTNTAYFMASEDPSTDANLYTLNLTTGATTLVGMIGTGMIVDAMAVQIDVVTPATVAGQIVYGLTSNSYLVSFDSEMPTTIRSHKSISGITAGQTIVGMDSRPATGQLYLLGYNSTTGDAQLYTLDPSSGVATSVAAAVTLATAMTNVSFDFNPTVDRIRVTSAEDNNYRLHPTTGALAFTDGNLAYNATDINSAANPRIAGGAYTNSYIGSTSTQLIGYDADLNTLTLQNPPNNGTLNTIGASGVMVNAADQSIDFDFFYNTGTAMNENYVILNPTGTNFDNLYTADLSTGALTLVGKVGFGTALTDMAVQIIPNIPGTIAGQIVYGLTSNSYLVSFDSEMPSVVRSHKSISGITAGQTIVGMDSRPATGQLYLLGYNSTTGDAQLYTLDPATGAATSVAAAVTLATTMTNVSFDFNPTVDRIRVTSAEDNNYRLHPTTGALAFTDGNLAYNATDANSAANPRIAGGAYTNSYIGSTSTQLIGYDADLNVVTLQNPPNNGTLNTLGASGVTANAADQTIDFDFFFNTATSTNENYVTLNPTGTNFDNLYTVNTTTGALTLVGQVGSGTALTDIAVQIVPNIPGTVSGEIVYGVTSNQYLITFDSEMPSVVRTHTAISGITTGQVIAGLDVRPATGELYALGYNSTTGDAQLYTINPTSGAATSVAAAVVLAPALGNIGMDFNPTVDRIRVVTSTGMNYRMHPTTGALAATDGNLAYAAGDANSGATPAIGSGAYTNSYGGSNNTVLFDYDDALNLLVRQAPPNAGTLNTVGASGIVQSTTDVTSDLDIFYNHDLHTNTAFLISNAGTSDILYTVNTATGAATAVGTIGNGIAVRDIAVRNDSITAVSSTAATVSPVVCDSYTAANGAVYTTSGTYTVIIPNTAGYDSLITVNLVVNYSSASMIMETACDSYTAPDGAIYTASGTYTATIPNMAGCDSVITVMLTINNSTSSMIMETACDSYTAPDGAIYTASGTYTATIPNTAGCDSVITVMLTINNSTSSMIMETACDSYTAPDGTIYTASGTYTATIPNMAGCDSVITVMLTINNSTSSSIIATECTSYTAPDGMVYTASGTYSATIPNTAGCDSLITITLTITGTTTPTFASIPAFCQGTTAPVLPGTSTNGITGTWNPMTVSNTASGTYTFTPNPGQCATTASLTVTVNPAVTPTFNPIADLCMDDAAPALPTSSTNTPAISGTWNPTMISTAAAGTFTFTFTPSVGECATTATISVMVDDCSGIDEEAKKLISLYPNPTTGSLTIAVEQPELIVVRDAMGREVLTATVTETANTIDLSNFATGIYSLQIGGNVYSIVKQ